RTVDLTMLVEAREGDGAHWTELASTGERDQRTLCNGVESPLRAVGKPFPDEIRADDRLLTARLADAAFVLEDEPVADALSGAVAPRRWGTIRRQRFDSDHHRLPLRLVAHIPDKGDDLGQRSSHQDAG